MGDVYEVGTDGAFDLTGPPPRLSRRQPKAPVKATMLGSPSRGMGTNILLVLAAVAYVMDHESVAFAMGALVLLPKLLDAMMTPMSHSVLR
jgi:hypothetical protein